jgi:hypothetical protein
MFHRFRLERSRLTRALGAALLGVAAAGQALGNVLSDGGFESAYDYPCMYPHENARIKAFVDAGWDVGGVDKFRFPAVWTVRPAPAGYLRVSDDARGGRYALEFGKGGVIYAGSYVTPTESVGRYPFTEGHSCIIRVWAKGTGTLTARIREYAASGVRDVDVGAPESLTGDWRECIFLYTPEATAPEFIEVGFTADGVAKVDDAAMVDVVEFSRLVASLNDGLKTAQADARDGLVPTTAVEAVAAEVGGLARRACRCRRSLPCVTRSRRWPDASRPWSGRAGASVPADSAWLRTASGSSSTVRSYTSASRQSPTRRARSSSLAPSGRRSGGCGSSILAGRAVLTPGPSRRQSSTSPATRSATRSAAPCPHGAGS